MRPSAAACLAFLLTQAAWGADGAPPHRRVVLAVDASGSMNQVADSYRLADALTGFVGKLRPEDELAVVVFDDRASLARAASPVGSGPIAAAHQVRALAYDGPYSDVPAALALSCDVFGGGSSDAPIDVLLVTDGIVTVRAPRSSDDAIREMQERIVPRCAAAGVRVHVVGLGGSKARTATLQAIAEATDGRSEYPLGAARLAEFLDGYLAQTEPPPRPVPAPDAAGVARASAPLAGVAAQAPPPVAPRRSHAPFLIAGATALLALVVLLWLLLRRSSPAAGAVAGSGGEIRLREAKSGKVHVLPLPTTLGRSPSSPVAFDDREVSRKHVQLEMIDGRVHVTDLGSANGTFINGVRLKANVAHPLKLRDTLHLPGLELSLEPATRDFDETYIRQDLDRTIVRPTQPETPSR